MSNFRLLGKAMIDFSRVRSVIPATPEDRPAGNRLIVTYDDSSLIYLDDPHPEETLKEFYARERNLDDSIVVGEEE